MFKQAYSLVILFFSFAILSGCKPAKDDTLFTQLSPNRCGIYFKNDIHDSDSSYSFINEFGYMGGGVGIGDFNNDGLKDIFFTANQVSCRLYINKGDNRFEDITEKAGLITDAWATGVSIADVNNDGYDDIYVCVFGKDLLHPSKNLLFINRQNLTFTEEAEAYGLADMGFSTQAVFFDSDKDGDLDMYLVNYLLSGANGNTIVPIDRSGRSPANDRLYRNEGYLPGKDHPVFTDITLQANIKEAGFGLGVAVSDLNHDGWPDIYVANDFLSNDKLWLNNRDGTFTDATARALGHQSYSSMGADAADINNDGLPDIAVLDMLPEYNQRKKTSFFFMNYERYQAEREMGYEPEFMRNMLQLNNCCVYTGDTGMPFFSEIGQLAGIDATDWSWSVLLADFNNDGWKDMHVTNGVGRDFINGDFLEFSSKIFAGNQDRKEQEKAIRRRLTELKHVDLSNYLYLNNHDYTFTDASHDAGIGEPSMSNGAAYADLDNDGDLDLVVNNIGKEAFVFVNNTNRKNKPSSNHYISAHLKGDSLNRRGFGTKIFIYNQGKVQVQEQNPVRGYFSSVDQQLLFGLGKYGHIDSLVVVWPDDRKEVLKNIIIDTSIILSWQNAQDFDHVTPIKSHSLFTDITRTSGIAYRHHDNTFNDFANQRLLPQKYSQLGPYIATGDINKDGLTDLFVGNGFNFSGSIFLQQKERSFISRNLTDSIKMEEDMSCILFDADNDGDQDLLVAGGDVLFEENAVYYKPRLYTNDGKGNFSLRADAIPSTVTTIAGCITAGDYDADGDTDVFIGGRVSKKYPAPPRSFILQNNRGIFTDVTEKVCPALQRPGMVTSAIWTDLDEDKQTDLVIAGEWMPLRFFKNNQGRLTEVTDATGLTNTNGMWRSLIADDLDNDGDADLIAGNLGLNCEYDASPSEPMQLYAADLDGNGSIDPVFFYYIKNKDGKKSLYPAVSRGQLAEQVPAVKKRFLRYTDYAEASFDEIFTGKGRESLLRFHCDETRSCWFENIGNGKFIKHPLPIEAQFAPVNAIICHDLDNDGYKDLLLAGNEYQAEVIRGRYDASYGCFLKGGISKNFVAVPPAQSGFIVKGDVKDMALMQLPGREKMVLAAVNNDSLRVFRVGVNSLQSK